MSRKTESQLARDGVFMLVQCFAKGFQDTVKKSYDLGYDDAENAGRVSELENKARSYREEVRDLNKKIGRDAAAHDQRIKLLRELVANMRAELTKINAWSPEQSPSMAFFCAIEKELSK